jgi:localization factor PodJL
MNKSTAGKQSSVRRETWRLAEEAARRAGLSLEEWLDEVIVGLVAGDGLNNRSDDVRSHASEQPAHAWLDEAEDFLQSAIIRIERRMRRGEERLERVFETVTEVLERTCESIDRGAPTRAYRQFSTNNERRPPEQASVARPALHHRLDDRLEEIAQRIEAARQMGPNASLGANPEKRRLDLKAAVSQIALRRQALEAGRVSSSAGGGRIDQTAPADAAEANEPANSVNEAGGEPPSTAPPKESQGSARDLAPPCQERDQRLCASDLMGMREGIAAMNRSLAELAPRNSVVALEGAVRDLTERVALLRQEGERESLLAPLDAMAAELRASLKSRDLQQVVSGLEREIAALAGKIDSLPGTAISPESFDRIQQQTEEVRNLLAAAATRSAPLERLERQVGELADRIEQLGSCPAPQAESERMIASLADLRSEIERSTPLSALMMIERRLEHIAERLDREICQPAQNAADPQALEDLARRIDGVRQSLDARLEPQIDASALEASLKELTAKLANAGSDSLVALMRDISDKLDASGRKDAEADSDAVEPMLAEILGKLAHLPQPDSTAGLSSIERRLQELDAKLDLGAGHRFDRESVGEIAEEVARRLEKYFAVRIDERGLAEQIAQIHDRLEALASQDGVQGLARKLTAQMARMTGEPSSDDQDEMRSLAVRAGPAGAPASVIRGIEALEPTDSSTVRRPLKPVPPTNEDDSALAQSGSNEVLLEPGSGGPQRAREAQEPEREIGSKTSPSISAHIAAARRAAHSALSEGSAQNAPPAAPGIARARSLYANHRRPVLLAAALAIVATAAIRLIGAHVPVLQKSELNGPKLAVGGPLLVNPGDVAAPTGPTVRRVDPTPTASIAPQAGMADSPRATAQSQLSATLAAALPASLRDAVIAGSPAAQYELAQRLFDGRGVSQDQQTAALWLERAASSGLAPAQFRLGTLFSKGVGVERDAIAAKRWYRKAAEAGNARAAHNLAVMYAEPVGEAPDYAEAAKWFRKAAEMGIRDSQFNLAILYARGLGVDQDLRQAWLWFSLAAAQGDADAAKKRDEAAAKMDSSGLAAAEDDLAKFKVVKPDPAANEVASPPDGWDKAGASPLSHSAPASVGALPPVSAP